MPLEARCQPAAQRGFNWIGFASSENGIGQSQRGLMGAALAAGEAVSSLDISHLCPARADDRRWRHLPTEPVPGRQTIFHFNPPETAHVLRSLTPAIYQVGHNIAYWLWELPRLPEEWLHYARFYREIWTSSSFTAEAIRASVDVPVSVVPLPVEVPTAVTAEGRLRLRRDLGLPENGYLFGVVFDVNSTMERKNPLAVMRAFRDHLRSDDLAYLVVKANGITRAHAHPLVAPLVEFLRDDRIILIDEVWSRAQIDSFFDAIDCLVNLHRAEGFGLTLAEAMARGKPVIATDWSGSRDFFDATNGFPVDYRLVQIDRPYGPYLPGNTWAEPSVEHAGSLMRRCLQADDEVRQRCAKARVDIKRHYSLAAVAEYLRSE